MLIILIILNILSCSTPKEVAKIEIYKVDFAMTSIFKIECESFDKHFNNVKETVVLTKDEEVNKFINLIENIEPDTESYEPDVRAKVLIHYQNNETDTLCLSDLGMLFNGKSYQVDKKIVDFIEDL